MHTVVAYDIADPKRLRRVAKIMEDYAERMQKSVFEAELEPWVFRRMRRRIEDVIDPEKDGVKYYRLCGACRKELWVHGLEGESEMYVDYKVI
jgi:CRISPR-associated protein Cas2